MRRFLLIFELRVICIISAKYVMNAAQFGPRFRLRFSAQLGRARFHASLFIFDLHWFENLLKFLTLLDVGMKSKFLPNIDDPFL